MQEGERVGQGGGRSEIIDILQDRIAAIRLKNEALKKELGVTPTGRGRKMSLEGMVAHEIAQGKTAWCLSST